MDPDDSSAVGVGVGVGVGVVDVGDAVSLVVVGFGTTVFVTVAVTVGSALSDEDEEEDEDEDDDEEEDEDVDESLVFDLVGSAELVGASVRVAVGDPVRLGTLVGEGRLPLPPHPASKARPSTAQRLTVMVRRATVDMADTPDGWALPMWCTWPSGSSARR